ncbi:MULTISPECIES: aminopeptidase P family protein [unclassified Sedimentibacter]|uniref:aminopeptidase P family protein n=1 Tax=unclassified Sedimentibacter TaxID=2649220 RepID=UPI0027DFFD39|nr:aminopeptidase P family protein [Sedimentibacter sp. MB35-C1]WMJ78530.1 Xaa-Pro aminopeptidase [Sedimentibacter sp. MB35-C1]
MDTNFFVNNRMRFSERMKDCSSAVFFSGRAPRESADQLYDFSVNRNFFYLTGIDREDMILLIEKINGKITETLYIPPVDEHFEKWFGILMRKDEATQVSGIKSIQNKNEFMDQFAKKLSSSDRPDNVYVFSYITGADESYDHDRKLAHWMKNQFPAINIKNSLDLMIELRSSKTEDEVNEIKTAIGYTKEALEFVMKNLKPGKFEYQVKADFEYQLQLRGSRPSFKTIGASGEKAVILHYVDLKQKIKDGSLILLDLGALSNNYASDITRTYPANGKFSQRQKDIYNIVLEAQDVTIDAMHVGASEIAVNDAVKKHFAKGLKALNIIREDADVDKYYYHSIGHPLGLDVHDLRRRDKTMQENNVYTVEPGLYIKEEGIGIRIEDDVWVTKKGIINLSSDIIKTVNDIENFMK